jgi:hypothetical protein
VSNRREVAGENQAETDSLRQMLHSAEEYLISFKWCPAITERYLGYGVGGIIAVCLFRLDRSIKGTDDWLWVVVGDLPSAYLVVDEAPDATAAMGVYCHLMEDWANAVLSGRALNDVFPVNAEATVDNARMLLSRTRFIREKLIPASRAA